MTCPDPIQLEAFVDGELPEAAAAAVAHHVATCGRCAAYARRTRQLVALLQRPPVEALDELDVLRLVEAVRRGASDRRPSRWLSWRHSLVAAAVLMALGAGVVAYRANVGDAGWSPPDSFSMALLHEHQDYQAALAADPELNVQVAVVGQ